MLKDELYSGIIRAEMDSYRPDSKIVLQKKIRERQQ